MTNPRLDEWLVEQGHYTSRARARDAILRGCITLDGRQAAKASAKVLPGAAVGISDPSRGYVSRAALKLVHALEETAYSPSGRIALDIGASTGGFCQVLLKAGATHVYGIDVGHGQMDEALADHGKLTYIEGLNARDLSFAHLGQTRPQFITCDVSFISLKLALPPALALAEPGCIGIFLVKPQFEVGKEGLGKGGIVRDAAQAERAAAGIRDWLDGHEDWRVTHFLASPITGGDGNREYLLAAVKNG